MSVRRLTPVNTLAVAADPAAGRAGDLAWRTDLGQLRAHTGSAWVAAAPPGTLTDGTDYVPTLTTDTGTNPTLGTGATAQGRYRALGKLLVGQGRIIFGSGCTPGAGAFRVSLPAGPGFSGALGSGYVFDSSAPAWRAVVLEDAGSGMAYLVTSADGRSSGTSPWTVAAGDQVAWSFAYERT